MKSKDVASLLRQKLISMGFCHTGSIAVPHMGNHLLLRKNIGNDQVRVLMQCGYSNGQNVVQLCFGLWIEWLDRLLRELQDRAEHSLALCGDGYHLGWSLGERCQAAGVPREMGTFSATFEKDIGGIALGSEIETQALEYLAECLPIFTRQVEEYLTAKRVCEFYRRSTRIDQFNGDWRVMHGILLLLGGDDYTAWKMLECYVDEAAGRRPTNGDWRLAPRTNPAYESSLTRLISLLRAMWRTGELKPYIEKAGGIPTIIPPSVLVIPTTTLTAT